jgi:ornithine carbamoyltransferase
MSTQDGPALAAGSCAGLRGRHFVTDQDYTREELLGLLDLAAALKELYRRRPSRPSSRGAPWR